MHNDKNTAQWNEIKSLEINGYIYDPLIFNKGAKTVAWQKDTLLNTLCRDNGVSTGKTNTCILTSYYIQENEKTTPWLE